MLCRTMKWMILCTHTQIYIKKKAPSCAPSLEQVWTGAPHLQTCDSSKLSHVSGYSPTSACYAPKGLTLASQYYPSATCFWTWYNTVLVDIPAVPFYFTDGNRTVTVPDHEKPGSRCRLSKAHNWPEVLGIWNGEGTYNYLYRVIINNLNE
jgi:hypothetical protein